MSVQPVKMHKLSFAYSRQTYQSQIQSNFKMFLSLLQVKQWGPKIPKKYWWTKILTNNPK